MIWYFCFFVFLVLLIFLMVVIVEVSCFFCYFVVSNDGLIVFFYYGDIWVCELNGENLCCLMVYIVRDINFCFLLDGDEIVFVFD